MVGLVSGFDPLRSMPLIIDATGVGRACCDIIENSGLPNVFRVIITGGHEEARLDGGRTIHVPKLQLLSQLEAALHTKELRVARDLPAGEEFKRELLNFRVQRTDSGHITLGARSGAHDDILLSVAMALYWLRRSPRNRWSIQNII